MKAVYDTAQAKHDPQFYLVRGQVTRSAEQPERADRLKAALDRLDVCLLYTSPSPRDQRGSRMPSSA